MTFRRKITVSFLLYIALCGTAYAQVVEIPDPNLRAAILSALNRLDGDPITQTDMRRLKELEAHDKQITNLTGLEFATDLISLALPRNNISDLSSLTGLTQLEELVLWVNPISNLSSLANLTQLRYLALNGGHISDITPLANLTQLTSLHLHKNSIVDITPLASLKQLTNLWINYNGIVDIRPLADLTQLTTLRLNNNQLVDIGPLANLTRLNGLWINHNEIVDIRPLANLTRLTALHLNENQIVNIRPLANLIELESLEIHHNPILDYSPLDELALAHLSRDEFCEHPPLPVRDRIHNRNYPSIFARWSGLGWPPIVNRPELSGIENVASHDLWFSVPQFGLEWTYHPDQIRLVGNLDEAIRQRDLFLSLNPNMIFLLQVRMRSGGSLQYLPEDSPHWLRDADGNILEEELIDFTHPFIQDRIVQQAVAVSKCGLYDGIFFDWWHEEAAVLGDYVGIEAEQRARDIIIQRIRAETRPDFLIMVNTNIRTIPRNGKLINGGFMETLTPYELTGVHLEWWLDKTENSLAWLEQNLREPRINGVEGWVVPSELPDSHANLRWMRAITTLSLTHSDGYVVFTSALDGYHHYWYDFWDADLGRPLSEEKAQLYDEQVPGLYIREYTNGWAVYNHSGSEQQITLPELAVGVASRLEGNTHTLSDIDGEMYLRVKPANPADVNGDGVVNILDLVAVAQAFGKDGLQGDVNGDGVVNVFDLVQVAGAIGAGGAAPSAYSPELSIISAADVERWLAGAQGLGVGDANFQRGIRFLEGLLAALTPKETTLLPNYPNPFNPETWIPYRLARGVEVAITIYDTKGTLVRRLALGNQAPGHYAERGKAAYWDGRNEDGEAVASGIYIYQFRAGDYAASRRMVIVK